MDCSNVSVVIPALNEAGCIRRALDSCASAGEVIVVDGGSEDETLRIAEAAGAKVLQCEAGRAIQQNVGARAAAGKVLLFLHADNFLGQPSAGIVHPIQQISDALAANPNRWGGAMQQRIDAPGVQYRCLQWGNAMRVRMRGVPFGDQAIFVRHEMFERVGGFPIEPLMEDLILSQRLRRFAWPLLLPGPVCVSARRWQRYGVVRQTARNTALQLAYAAGVSPTRLKSHYSNHG